MAFLAPLFLLGALAAAVPIVLHLLRREPETHVKFAAVRLLQHAPVEHADKRRLRDLLLLALRVAALLLLALAFARPFLPASAAGATTGVTVVALDTSYSLSGNGRFARAQALARQAIADAPSGHLVGVVTFADSAQLTQEPSADRALAANAVNAAAVGFGATRYRVALGVAADAVGPRDGRIVVVTDLQASGWDSGQRVDLPSGIAVEIADVGPIPPNVAIVSADALDGRVVSTIRNSGESPRDVRLRVSVDDKPAGEAVHPVGAGQSVDVSMPVPAGRAATVAIDDPGGLLADDVRYVAIGDAARLPILVLSNAGDLSREAVYVEQALLASGGRGPAFTVTGASGAQVSAWDADRLSAYAAVVILSTRGLDQRGRELLAGFAGRGGGILIAAGPDVDGEVAGAAIGTALQVVPESEAPAGRSLAPVDLRHPVFRMFAGEAATLSLVRFRQVVNIRADACLPLARFSSGEAALLECVNGDGRALLLASDLDGKWNDFPVHATFVPFLHEAIDYLAGQRSLRTGFVVGAVPAGLPQTPGIYGRPAAVPGRNGTGSVVTDAGRTVVVNVDARESDGTRQSAAEFQGAIVPTPPRDTQPSERNEARQQEGRQNLWRYAILLMIAALMVESVLASRTA